MNHRDAQTPSTAAVLQLERPTKTPLSGTCLQLHFLGITLSPKAKDSTLASVLPGPYQIPLPSLAVTSLPVPSLAVTSLVVTQINAY